MRTPFALGSSAIFSRPRADTPPRSSATPIPGSEIIDSTLSRFFLFLTHVVRGAYGLRLLSENAQIKATTQPMTAALTMWFMVYERVADAIVPFLGLSLQQIHAKLA